MPIQYEDVTSSFYRGIIDATAGGQPLNGSNVLYPGEDYDTTSLASWATPFISELIYDHTRRKGGLGVATILIWSRIAETKAVFLRDILANNFRQALEGEIITVKNYQTGDGLSTLGYMKFTEGQLISSAIHGDGIYASTWNIPFRLEES